LVLPIPRTEKTVQGAWRVLPGAPLAFCRKRPNGYEDTATMATFCEVEGDFPPSVIQELRGYFGEPQSQGIKNRFADLNFRPAPWSERLRRKCSEALNSGAPGAMTPRAASGGLGLPGKVMTRAPRGCFGGRRQRNGQGPMQ